MRHLIFAVLAFLLCTACDGVTPFERDNTFDPGSAAFRPAAPALLQVSVVRDTARLQWRDMSEYEDGYLIERSVDDTTSFEVVAELAADDTTYTEYVRDPGFWVTYRVSAFVRRGGERQQRVVQSTVSFNGFDNEAPTVEVQTERAIRVQWRDPYRTEERFVIERRSVGANERIEERPFEPIATVGRNTTEYVDTSPLESRRSYYYRIRAERGGINGPYSAIGGTYLQVSPPRYFRISNTANVRDDQVALLWQEGSVGEQFIEGYIVERSDEQSEWKQVAELSADAQSFTDDGLDPAIRYAYRVRTLSSLPSQPVAIRYGSYLSFQSTWRGSDGVTEVAFSESGDIVYIGTQFYCKTRLVAWDWKNNRELFAMRTDHRVNFIGAIPGADRILIAMGSSTGCSQPGGIDVLDGLTGDLVRRLYAERALTVALSADGRKVATFPLGPIEVLDVETGAVLHTLGRASSYSAAFHPTQPILAVGGYDDLLMYNLETNSLQTIAPYTGYLTSLEYSPDGAQLLAGPWFHDPETGVRIRRASPELPVTFGPGEMITTRWKEGVFGSVTGIDLRTYDNERVARIQTYDGTINAIDAQSGGRYIVSGSGRGVVKVWSLENRWGPIERPEE